MNEKKLNVNANGATGDTELDAEDAKDIPLTLVAVTVNVYAVPFVSPVTVIGLDAPVPVCPPDDVTVYPVIAEPPVAGAVNVTLADALPAVAVPIVGAAGLVVAVMLLDAEDTDPGPTAVVAVIVKVYAVADCNPSTVIGDVVPVPVKDPGEDVTVYPVIGSFPSNTGAVNGTVANPLLNARVDPVSDAVPIVGASGVDLVDEETIPGIIAIMLQDLQSQSKYQLHV